MQFIVGSYIKCDWCSDNTEYRSFEGLTLTQEDFKEGFSHCRLCVMEREEFCAERQAAMGKL